MTLEPEKHQPELFGSSAKGESSEWDVPNGTALMLIMHSHTYAYRAFYAIRTLNFPSGDGAAIYGFKTLLQELEIQEQNNRGTV